MRKVASGRYNRTLHVEVPARPVILTRREARTAHVDDRGSAHPGDRGGRPRSAKGLSNVISRAVKGAELSRISAHGLRKTRLTRIADAGGTTHQIMSWGGHASLSEVEHYTQSADQKRQAMEPEQNGKSAITRTKSANTGGK